MDAASVAASEGRAVLTRKSSFGRVGSVSGISRFTPAQLAGRRNAADFGACLMFRFGWRALLILPFLGGMTARALIFYSTGDPGFNTEAPTGLLQDSGWQYQGFWGGFLGTPISSNLFLTAAHVGGNIGQAFVFQGQSFVTSAVYDDPESDLRLWQVRGEFSRFAPVLTNTIEVEVGKTAVLFGRGTQRGGEVRLTNALGSELKGWTWGPADSVLRWGENVVTRVVSGDTPPATTGVGDLLLFRFDASGGANEAIFSAGDSAGGAFVWDEGVWKLAGINYGVDGPFGYTADGVAFDAAVFDRGGFYESSGQNFTFIPDTTTNRPSGSYATRVAARWPWIQRCLAAAAANPEGIAVQSTVQVGGVYIDVAEAVVDGAARTVTLTGTAETQFYRLRAGRSLRITAIQAFPDRTVLTYE